MFIYFPSFSVGGFGDGLRKNIILKNGLESRFYSDTFPKKYRHPYFLITAGHYYKKKDFRKEMGFPDDVLVIGDSGGFQIASGAIEWSKEFRHNIFTWLEENSDLAMNLDIPPKMKYKGKVKECLEISKDNFKYFADNRTGTTDFLNVLQGADEHSFKHWYNEVKQFPFDGWAIGNIGGNIYKFISGMMTLLDGKEHLNPNRKYIHFFATSRIPEFLMLSQLQKSLTDIDSKMKVTTDSSTPDRAIVFGNYYTSFNLKKGTFQSINFPKHEAAEILREVDGFELPYVIEFDNELDGTINVDDVIKWNVDCTLTMRLHNFYFFVDTMNKLDSAVKGHDYVLSQLISKDMFRVLKSIDEMVKSDSPHRVFEKYKPLYIKLSNTMRERSIEIEGNPFFDA